MRWVLVDAFVAVALIVAAGVVAASWGGPDVPGPGAALTLPLPGAAGTSSATPVRTYDCSRAVDEGRSARYTEPLGRYLGSARRPDVWRAQHELYELGYLTSFTACDGRFGPATEGAVKEFQGAIGMERYGFIGRDTWRALIPAGPDATGPASAWPAQRTPG